MAKRKRVSYKTAVDTSMRKRRKASAKAAFTRVGRGAVRSMSQSVANARYQSRKMLGTVSRNPFPDMYKTTLTYPIDTFVINPGAVADSVIIFKLNSLYDFDYTNVIGNTQPDYLDQIISATGPYKNFLVKGWRLKAIVDNLCGFGGNAPAPIHVIIGQGYLIASDCNSYTKMKHLPNTQHDTLNWYGEPPTRSTMEINGKVRDYIPSTVEDESLVGNYGGDPTTLVYGALAWSSPTYSVNAFAPTVSITIHMEFDAEFYLGDGTSS